MIINLKIVFFTKKPGWIGWLEIMVERSEIIFILTVITGMTEVKTKRIEIIKILEW